MDRLEGNDAAIERRKLTRRKIELEEQYQEALRIGNAEAIADAQESLRLFERIHRIKMQRLGEQVQAERELSRERNNGLAPPNRLLPVRLKPAGEPGTGGPPGLSLLPARVQPVVID